MEAVKGTILEPVRIRGETDRIMSPIWILAPFISVLVGLVAGVVFVTGGVALGLVTMVVGYVIALALMVYVIYHLIKRRTAHFSRDARLREAIIEYLKAKAGKKNISTELATMTTIHSEAMGEEREKSAVVWTILTFIVPFVRLYVLYFLTRDVPAHDRRQLTFMQQTQSAGSKLGMSFVVPSWKALPGRSFFLYFILTLITGGLFGLYWYYVLIKDPNQHFKAQWQFEDGLASSIS